MDLSKNFFSGTIPYCFYNVSLWKLGAIDSEYSPSFYSGPVIAYVYPIYKHLLNWKFSIQEPFMDIGEVGIYFVTKYRSNSYQGSILDIMSGLNLSFNKLTGEIPSELGQLSLIHALNLSYNQLTGSIPETFSELTQLESLDLSHNHLSGEIPTALIDLTSLEVFNVSHNNLSGKLPDMKAQFATFEKSSYEGNPFLCGPPLEKSCSDVIVSPPSPQNSSKASDRKWYEVDLPVFSTSFLVSFTVFFLGVVSILYINPHWRQQSFNLVEDQLYVCIISFGHRRYVQAFMSAISKDSIHNLLPNTEENVEAHNVSNFEEFSSTFQKTEINGQSYGSHFVLTLHISFVEGFKLLRNGVLNFIHMASEGVEKETEPYLDEGAKMLILANITSHASKNLTTLKKLDRLSRFKLSQPFRSVPLP
ncbi:cuscuta receptor 1-like [Quercus suber]|uniref:cuscuta receptor 1-like n=1 Tax=Quercus suber TaxID=58331 RepID=UPI0032DFFD2B